jgi:hypothetical protein
MGEGRQLGGPHPCFVTSCHITSPGCRTRRLGAAIAPLLLANAVTRARVGRRVRSERSQQRRARCRGGWHDLAACNRLSKNPQKGAGGQGGKRRGGATAHRSSGGVGSGWEDALQLLPGCKRPLPLPFHLPPSPWQLTSPGCRTRSTGAAGAQASAVTGRGLGGRSAATGAGNPVLGDYWPWGGVVLPRWQTRGTLRDPLPGTMEWASSGYAASSCRTSG